MEKSTPTTETGSRVRPIEPGEDRLCERIMRALPGWFGIESAIVHYAGEAARLPTWIAVLGGEPAGFLTLKRHTPHAAEISCMAVLPQFHRRGVGRALLRHAEAQAAADGVRFLQVKTVSQSGDSAEYARTRLFYEAEGFLPVEEFPDLWPGNPCVMYLKSIAAR